MFHYIVFMGDPIMEKVKEQISEKEKHWSKIKFHATKWREYERLETNIKLQIINLQVDMDHASKQAKLYMQKTRSLILLEVV